MRLPRYVLIARAFILYGVGYWLLARMLYHLYCLLPVRISLENTGNVFIYRITVLLVYVVVFM